MTGQPNNVSAGESEPGMSAGNPGMAGRMPERLPPDLCAAALLRAHADDEVRTSGSHEQTAKVERWLTDEAAASASGVPQAAARVEFERALRPACNRCLCAMAGQASQDLRAKVQALVGQGLAQATLSETKSAAAESVTHAGRTPGDRIPGRAPAGRRSPARRWAMSIGATAIHAGASVAVYQAVINAGTVQNDPQTFTAQLASFVSTEHQRTALDSDAAKAKFGCTDASRVCADFSPTLGESPSLPTLGGEHDLAFQGAGPCGVPGGPSIHVRFYTRHDADGHMHEMSLFVQRDSGRLELDEGRVYSLECPSANVDVWRRGGLVYYLVSDAHGCDCFREAAGIGEPTGVVRAK